MAKDTMKMSQIGETDAEEVMRKLRKSVVNSIIAGSSRPRPQKQSFGKGSVARTKE